MRKLNIVKEGCIDNPLPQSSGRRLQKGKNQSGKDKNGKKKSW